MSENTAGDKTEKPSQQKLKKSREQGQVVRSRDLGTAIGILVSLKLVVLLVPGYLDDFRSLFAQGFASLDGDGTLDNTWSTTAGVAMGLLLKMILPLFVVPLAGVIGGLFPGGWVISVSNWAPKFERLSPAKNLGRLVEGKHAFELATSIFKAATLSLVLVHVARSTVDDHVHLQSLPLDAALLQGAGLLVDGVMAMCAVFIAFALIDVPAQAFFFARGQRMSKQEVKEEHKSNEGRPEVKQRIRQLQRQMARRGVRKTVPTADVVIVNPEHYAVALKYDEHRAEAPYVVAKGVDEMALYIREVAAEHGIETVPLPPLARAIYNTSQVQQQIPMALYKAVAQVLTYVLQIQAFRTGRYPAEPQLPTGLAVPAHLSEVANS
jgi:flagellar biosynthetic protein FlhB